MYKCFSSLKVVFCCNFFHFLTDSVVEHLFVYVVAIWLCSVKHLFLFLGFMSFLYINNLRKYSVDNCPYLQIIPFIICILDICSQCVIYLLIYLYNKLNCIFKIFSVVNYIYILYTFWVPILFLHPPLVDRLIYPTSHLCIFLKFTLKNYS